MNLVPSEMKQTGLRTAKTNEPQRTEQVPMFSPFLSFTYSSQEMHTVAGQTYVKSQQVRYEDGRLTSEQFEGQLPMAVYSQAVYETQRSFAEQTIFFVRLFSSLLPLFMKTPGAKE